MLGQDPYHGPNQAPSAFPYYPVSRHLPPWVNIYKELARDIPGFRIIGVLAGIAYTAPPLSYKYKGLGEFSVFLMGTAQGHRRLLRPASGHQHRSHPHFPSLRRAGRTGAARQQHPRHQPRPQQGHPHPGHPARHPRRCRPISDSSSRLTSPLPPCRSSDRSLWSLLVLLSLPLAIKLTLY